MLSMGTDCGCRHYGLPGLSSHICFGPGKTLPALKSLPWSFLGGVSSRGLSQEQPVSVGEKSGKGARKGCERERKMCSVQPSSRDKFKVKSWDWRVSSSVRLSAFVLNP